MGRVVVDSVSVSTVAKMEEERLLVFTMVLSKAPVRVLTLLHEERWHLPRFEYKTDYPYNSSYCVRDLENTLDSSCRKFRFDVVAELFPREDDDLSCYVNPKGLNRLTLLEAQSEEQLSYELPPHAKWTDVKDVLETAGDEMLDYYYYYVSSAVYLFLHPYAEPTACLTDPRATKRWTHRAVDFLVSTIRDLNLKPTSDVTRVAWVSTSEIFRVNTCEGWYYLKAPHPGCAEVGLAKRLSELFPEDTLEVVGVNESLNCFVAKGVDRVLENWSYAEKIMWKKLVRMQRELVDHVTELKELGVPVYSAGVLGEKIDEWVLDPVVDEKIGEEGMTGEQLSYTLKKVCDRMERSRIPLTLVHGDFMLRNFGKRDDVTQDEGYVLYDWGWACIAHPFSDCRFEDYKKDEVEEYKSLWLDYTTENEIEKEWRLGEALGWMAQMGNGMYRKELGTSKNESSAAFLVEIAASKLVAFIRKHSDLAEMCA